MVDDWGGFAAGWYTRRSGRGGDTILTEEMIKIESICPIAAIHQSIIFLPQVLESIFKEDAKQYLQALPPPLI